MYDVWRSFPLLYILYNKGIRKGDICCISPFCYMAGNSDKVGDAKAIGQKSEKLV